MCVSAQRNDTGNKRQGSQRACHPGQQHASYSEMKHDVPTVVTGDTGGNQL